MKSKNRALKPTLPEPPQAPCLVFDPLCWLKLQFFCHFGDTEIGGFAISADDNPLYVEQFQTVMQGTSAVSVEFADSAVADYFDQCIDAGMKPQQFARVWLHTHPGDSPEPSSVDERTFAEVFGKCDWSVMFILSRTGRTYARLAFNAGPGASIQIPVTVDWERWPQRLEDLQEHVAQWRHEHEANIHPLMPRAAKLMEERFDEMELWYDEQRMLDAYQELARATEVS